MSQASMPGVPPPANPELPLPRRYTVSNPPNSIQDTRSLPSWQELFKARRAWALKVVEDCAQMASVTRDRYSEMDVMLRCLDVATANLEAVIKGLEPKYAELKKWAPEAQADYTILATRWEQYLALARSISISPDMLRFISGHDITALKGRLQRQATLEDLVDLDLARRSGRLAPAILRKLTSRVADLDKVAARLFQDADVLFRDFEKTVNRSALSHENDSSQLLQDIEAVAKKIDTDYQTILGYSGSARDVPQASKTAANHTERLLPSVRNRAQEMDEMLRYATQARNGLAAESVEFMRNITEITSLAHAVKSQLGAVHQDDELATFDYLRFIQQAPYIYASFVAEAVKRREWLEKVKQDSATLVNEMALFQEEEIKRRRKWYKSISSAYRPASLAPESKALGLEVNLRGDEEDWPNMTRKDMDELFNLLQKHRAEPKLVADVGKLMADLDNPTRQQLKRMKAFKNGSVHEAALGRSGLLIRGDDDLLRSLQDDKSKLESKLKTADSRVRRLEDLLHRQTQASRPSLGNLFPPPGQQLSARNDSTISVKSPHVLEDRRGSLEGADVLANRIQQLEAELSAEKERSAALEKDLDAQMTLHSHIRTEIEEANSTKNDLLKNMEALKREFLEERKSLEDDIKRLHARLEDTEDEIEHFGESRENEKASYDEKVHALEMEIERLLKEKKDEELKSEGQVEFLRKEARLQHERVETQEGQLQIAQDKAKGLNKRIEALEETVDKQQGTLQEIWQRLSPHDPAPADFADLLEGVVVKVADMLGKMQDLEGEVSLLKLDLEGTQTSAKQLRENIAVLNEELQSEQTNTLRLRECLSEEKAKAAALEGELADGREQLSQLRVKIAHGETGSESLRKRLEEEEERLASVTEELASRQSHVGSLEEELRHYKERLQTSQSTLSELTARLDLRTERAKDLTQKLYAQNERLARLLDRLGFSVTRNGSSMVIQKIPRSERSAANAQDPDPGSSLRRSSTMNSRNSENVDLELLHWMNGNTDAIAESEKYEAFKASLGLFDMDVFSDAIYRRVKEVEHLARKLQRDTRAYRDKMHILQKDAHDKIAFKNFKEGDLALFLPTRNQTTGAWAAFNVNFPHYFLREQETHRLRSREWLVARITRIQERVVDLSKSMQQPLASAARKDVGAETESLNEDENDNPFDLSDGLRWYLIDAHEDKPGAPTTPGLAKSTVAANNVEAMADMHTHGRPGSKNGVPAGRGAASSGIEGVSKTLSKSLESRRSSTGSRKALPFAVGAARGRDSPLASETNSLRAAPTDSPTVASPSQQHALHQGTTQKPMKPLQDNGSASASPDDRHTSDEAQAEPQVRSDIDSLVGP